MTYLHDINVLVALFDAAHVHHEAAHRWFAAVGNTSWATCPITENGVVRVLSNPAYPTVWASPADVTERLRIFCTEPGHVFWQDVVSLTDSTLFEVYRLSGHQQITDLYLAGMAARFKMRTPLGYSAVLSRNRWREIIRFKHPALDGQEQLVRECLRRQTNMEKVRVHYDRQGNTLSVWFDDPKKEAICEEADDDVVLVKDRRGHVIGFERLNYLSAKQRSRHVSVPVEVQVV